MRTFLIVLLILIPIHTNARQKSYEWDINGQMKKFEEKLNTNYPGKCSETNFTALLTMSYELYNGMKLMDALERLNVQNQIYPVKWIGDQVALEHLKERLDEDAQISYQDVVKELKVWYHRNCVKHPRSSAITVRGLTSVAKGK